MEIFQKLDKIYDSFFVVFNIDLKTGIVANTNKRFATKVAIGDKYFAAKKKVLFVSLDIGKDEYYHENRFQSYKERRENALYYSVDGRNPHMAGVYGVALYFLKDIFGWVEAWSKIENSNQFFRESLLSNKSIVPTDVLSNVAMINFYNYVTIGRTERTGGNDRFLLNEASELQLLVDIINEINPDTIIVQSKTLNGYFRNKIKPFIEGNTDIYVSYHPSVFGRGIKYRNPKLHIADLIKNKI